MFVCAVFSASAPSLPITGPVAWTRHKNEWAKAHFQLVFFFLTLHNTVLNKNAIVHAHATLKMTVIIYNVPMNVFN